MDPTTVDLRKLRLLIEMVRGSGIAELEFRDASRRVRVANARSDGSLPVPPAERPAPALAAPPPAEPGPPAPHVITSPRVGTLHRANAPDARPFVDVGDAVEAGSTLCVIEAMKLRSDVHADRAGIVASALVEEGQPVEYGQPLFVIA